MKIRATTGGLGKIGALTGSLPMWSCPLITSLSPRRDMTNAETMMLVTPLERKLEPELRAIIDAKAKPLAAPGRIEAVGTHIWLLTKSFRPNLRRAAPTRFA